MFVETHLDVHALDPDATFKQVGRRLIHTDSDGAAAVLRMTTGEQVRLQLPSGFTALRNKLDGSVISVSQWLDDDHVVVWAYGGGGDLPAQRGDLLVCQLPDGACRVAVQRSSRPYVAP